MVPSNGPKSLFKYGEERSIVCYCTQEEKLNFQSFTQNGCYGNQPQPFEVVFFLVAFREVVYQFRWPTYFARRTTIVNRIAGKAMSRSFAFGVEIPNIFKKTIYLVCSKDGCIILSIDSFDSGF